MTKTKSPANFKQRRFAATLAFLGMSEKAMARACGCSNVHLHAVVTGARKPSRQLNAAIMAQLGNFLGYVHGDTDVLNEGLL